MDYTKLVIVGNGLDLFLKLPTSFSNFRKYLEARRNDLFEFVYSHLVDEVCENDLWSDFEDNLSRLGIDSFVTFWGNDNEDAEDIKMYLKEIQNYIYKNFFDWISELDDSIPEYLSQIEYAHDLKSDCLFINFNYTTTLEKYYNVPPEKIYYIHGCIARDHSIIMGHNRYKKCIASSFQPEFSSYQLHAKYLLDYLEKTDKHCNLNILNMEEYFENLGTSFDTILSNINEVFVLGHSLKAVDHVYFNYFASKLPSTCKWNISFFGEKIDEEELAKIGIHNITQQELPALLHQLYKRTY